MFNCISHISKLFFNVFLYLSLSLFFPSINVWLDLESGSYSNSKPSWVSLRSLSYTAFLWKATIQLRCPSFWSWNVFTHLLDLGLVLPFTLNPRLSLWENLSNSKTACSRKCPFSLPVQDRWWHRIVIQNWCTQEQRNCVPSNIKNLES